MNGSRPVPPEGSPDPHFASPGPGRPSPDPGSARAGAAPVYVISRTDGIGDVVLTLPLAAALRRLDPASRIVFLGREETRPVVEACVHVDGFVPWTTGTPAGASPGTGLAGVLATLEAAAILHVFPRREIADAARRARIPLRIGTNRRWYHFWTCNRLVPVARRGSALHEAQLNLLLLAGLGGKGSIAPTPLDEIGRSYGLARIPPLAPELRALLAPDRFNCILHPRSRGSAREWGIPNWSALIGDLRRNGIRVFVTGTREEGASIRELFAANGLAGSESSEGSSPAIDLTGRLSLADLIAFVASADGLVAASTGPLHLAAALGKFALGLYAPFRPIWPARWAPVGPRARFLVASSSCAVCRKGLPCNCMASISPADVLQAVLEEAGHLRS